MKNKTVYNMDEKLREKFSGSKLTGKNVLAGIGVLSLLLMAVGGGLAATSGTKTVGIGQNGVHIYSGSLNVDGNDIQDAGTVIWDASSAQVATSVIDYTAATASDVGLGNVRNIDLANTGGSFLTYDTNNEEYNVDGASIQSGTTASDVGLGNVENVAAVNESGDTMSGNLNLGGNQINNAGSVGTPYISGSGGTINFDKYVDSTVWIQSSSNSDSDVELSAYGNITFFADSDSGEYQCYISASNGSWNCDGTKNWMHDINSTHTAYYTSQESPQVRAVYEGKATITGKETVELPYHFSATVSDSKPMLRAQVTPQGTFTKAVVMDKTDDNITIKVGKETKVNYRITGIRDGYEDKDIVRKKQKD